MIQQITLQSLKECADQRYTWPGGYEMYAVCTDGELLCMPCIKDNWRDVSFDTAADPQGWGGWAVMGITHDGEMEPDEGPVYCYHCNNPLGPDNGTTSA